MIVGLLDILDCARLIRKYVDGLDREVFDSDVKTQDAIIRRLEIIGEATKHLTTAFRQEHAHIPWKQMAGMRDIAIHDYSEVDLDLVWNVAEHEIPVLITQLETLTLQKPPAEDT